MPALGMAQDSGKIIRWLKAEGDLVELGEALLEVETDKVTVEIESESAGLLDEISAAEGDDIPVGTVIAMVYGAGEERVSSQLRPELELEEIAPRDVPHEAGPTNHAGTRQLSSPKARRLAAAHGVEITDVTGTGPRGAVRASDVLLAVASGGSDDEKTDAAELEPHSRLWERMTVRLTESWRDAPHFFLQRDIDASELLRWKDSCNRGHADSVTLTDVFVSICARVIANHPRLRSQWTPGGLLVKESVDIGIAVAVSDGLVVPVIRSADSKSIGEVARERAALVDGARAGQLTLSDMTGGVFTISNLGMFGIDAFRAILNPPEAAILAVGRIRPVVWLASGVPIERPMITITLSCDHRVVDGARAAVFLSELADTLENPLSLLN